MPKTGRDLDALLELNKRLWLSCLVD